MFQQIFGDLKDKIIEQEGLRSTWFKPRPFTADLPGDLESRLKKAISDAQQDVQKSESSFNALLKRKYFWVGSLLRDSNNELKPWIVAGKPPNGQLLTLKPVAGETQAAYLVPIGTIKNGETKWSLLTAGTLSGRPLFYLQDR